MMNQEDVLPGKTLLRETKPKIVKQNESALLQKSKKINEKLIEQARRTIAKTREKGASTWLSVLPLEEFGFVLNKKDSERCPKTLVCLRIAWTPLPAHLWPAVQLIMH